MLCGCRTFTETEVSTLNKMNYHLGYSNGYDDGYNIGYKKGYEIGVIQGHIDEIAIQSEKL
jgi:membrane carboxypeptidase/penicillin-binding protein PbpC